MDHQPAAASDVPVIADEETHESGAGLDGCPSQNDKPRGGQLAVEADVLSHHPGHLGPAAEGRQFDDDQLFVGDFLELRTVFLVYIVPKRRTA
jgi:hypothetical protein